MDTMMGACICKLRLRASGYLRSSQFTDLQRAMLPCVQSCVAGAATVPSLRSQTLNACPQVHITRCNRAKMCSDTVAELNRTAVDIG